MVEYPPYVDAYGRIKDLFQKIKEAAVPVKATNDFLYTKLALKSTSYRAMIPLLRRLGFIDQANVPTQAYRDYRDEGKSKVVMANRIRAAYSDLFSVNEYAHKLTKEEVVTKMNTYLGTPKDDKVVPKAAATFVELCKLANFEGEILEPEEKPEDTEKPILKEVGTKLGISYTIYLNLPATTDIEVFNAIFKSIKENLLK